MKRSVNRLALAKGPIGIVFGAVVLVSVIGLASAQDPVKVAPQVYKVLFENDSVRVLDIHLKPGGKSPMHSHPDYVVYSFGPGKVKFTSPDGKETVVDLKAGETTWHPAETHAAENVGTTEIHVLNVELKQSGKSPVSASEEDAARPALPREGVVMSAADVKWADPPPGLPAGSKTAVLEGDPQKPGPFTMRIKFPAGAKVPLHWHPDAEHVTVLSGAANFGIGDAVETAKKTKLAAGSFVLIPARARHFAWMEEETVIQIHGVGPWGITYVNPADDPRGKK